eukprot:470087-Pleurochrysis_carterae.AAC.1
MVQHGDKWRSSTTAIESRGARLKRIGRACVSWRKAVNGWSSYSLTAKGKVTLRQKTAHQSYASSAVQQLLMKAAATE